MTVSKIKQVEVTINTVNNNLSAYQSILLRLYFYSPSFFDMSFNCNAAKGALSNIGFLKGDGSTEPSNLTLYGLKVHQYNTYNAAQMVQLIKILYYYEEYYLKVTFYTGATAQSFCQFGKVSSVETVPVKNTQYTAVQPKIKWEAHDPFWYNGESAKFPVVLTATMTTGNLQYCVMPGLTWFDLQRWRARLTVNVAGQSIKNPKIETFSDATIFAQITGSISALGDYYEIDFLKGTVIEYDASAGTTTNIESQFSGVFFASTAAMIKIAKITTDPTGGTNALITFSGYEVY